MTPDAIDRVRWINDSTLFTFAGKVSVIYTACLRMLRDVFGQQVTWYSDSDVSLNQIASFMQLLIVGTCQLLSTSALGVAAADFV